MDPTRSVGTFGFKTRGDAKCTDRRSPYIMLSLRQIFDLLPFLSRYVRWWFKQKKAGETMFIDSFCPYVAKPIYGVPCGGIGSGSIGRGFRGEFCKFALRPGLVEHGSTVTADQFMVNVRKNGATVYQQVLCCAPPRAGELSSWSFGFPAANLEFLGLYPRSWTTFRIPGMAITLTCRQVSPVFPDNYSDISFPTTLFVWTIESGECEPVSVSIVFTFRDGIGRAEKSQRCTAYAFKQAEETNGKATQCEGVALRNFIDGMQCTYALATESKTQQDVSFRSFDPNGSGAELWSELCSRGAFRSELPTRGSSDEVSALGIAMCVRCTLTPTPDGVSRAEIPMCLAWDMPVIRFGGRRRDYKRRYTRYFGAAGDAAGKLCAYALASLGDWEARIDNWQQPILSNPELPAWYKSAIMNELYYMTDGGSTWVEFDSAWLTDEPQMSAYTADILREYGRFAYLESWEYRMFNTYDVHFYASFAMAMLWPMLELSIQADFCDQIPHSTTNSVCFHFEGDVAPSKTAWRVPHDLGSPAQDPWLFTNAYEMHDTAKWKDLNLKFILQSYRDYRFLKNDERFLRHVWPATKALIAIAIREWDIDKDSMIENANTCDQTYDAWIMNGTSAYCGSLWLAALFVAAQMADVLGEGEQAVEYRRFLADASRAFHEKLWTGSYFKFDEHSRHSDSVMADQLCGIWYLRCCGFSYEVLSREKIQRSLRTVFELNVCGFCDGLCGAVNAMRTDGHVDDVCIQGEEVWTGVSYALASFLIAEGFVNEGFQTAEGVYRSCFEKMGLQYQTPEAYYATRWCRAIGYMRPLSIWAMQWVLERRNEGSRSVSDAEPMQRAGAVANGLLSADSSGD